jgi:hypothetical protein
MTVVFAFAIRHASGFRSTPNAETPRRLASTREVPFRKTDQARAATLARIFQANALRLAGSSSPDTNENNACKFRIRASKIPTLVNILSHINFSRCAKQSGKTLSSVRKAVP